MEYIGLGFATLLCLGAQLVLGGNCPSEHWRWFDGRCFRISDEEAPFSYALESCEQRGGKLATIDSTDIQTFIANLVKTTNKRQVAQLHTDNDLPNNKNFHYVDDLGIDVTGHTSVVFSIKSCAGGHILLSKVKGVFKNETYHVTVGGNKNTASSIKERFEGLRRSVFKHPAKSNPLKCNVYQTFWMSWGAGAIRVGYGDSVGKDEFLFWEDPTPHDIKYIGVATGWGNTADWVFTTETFVPGKFWIEAAVAGYTNWGVDEPTTTNPDTHCISMDMHDDMTWDDDACQQERNYVCQRSDVW